MRKKHVGIAVPALLGLLGIVIATRVGAHGSVSDPVSRSYACYVEGPEHPTSAACQAAVALGGTQPFYDWHEVNIADAAGRHRQIIPDGHLCSAGRDKYRGLDLARADWPSTNLTAGADTTLTYKATAPHKGSFELYVTRDGYQPTQPLRWADLEDQPFARATDPPLAGGAYQIAAHLPAKSGRHLIYTIWQRSDSPEAFYTCSDVDFGGGGNGGGAPAPAPSPAAPAAPEAPAAPAPAPTTAPGPAPAPTTAAPAVPDPAPGDTGAPAPGAAAPAWGAWQAYAVGDRVSHDGQTYRCRQAHTSQPDWAPSPATLALWLPENG